MYNYNVNIKPYVHPYNLRGMPAVKQDEQAQNPSDVEQQRQTDSFENNKDNENQGSGGKHNRQQYPNQKSAIDYNASKINISQILVDFNNTMKAIGASADVEDEVSAYLELVKKQSQKDNPSPKIIKANLKNASQILDEFITSALNKKSKVVENWVDALFLQQVDYNADETVEEPQEAAVPETVVEINSQYNISDKKVFLPENKQLRSLYVKAKKYSNIDQPQKALEVYNNALSLAQELDDKETQSAIHLNKGKIFDKQNQLSDALECYNSAAVTSKEVGNYRICAKAHYEMASIYDDMTKFAPAMQHYFEALSLDGENENLKRQTKTLNNIGIMYTERYDKTGAVVFYANALDLAKEIKDSKAMGNILGNTATLYEKFEDNNKAIKYYGQAVKCNENANDYQEAAFNYHKAGKLMECCGFKQKAITLYQKAYNKAVKANDLKLASKMDKKILELCM